MGVDGAASKVLLFMVAAPGAMTEGGAKEGIGSEGERKIAQVVGKRRNETSGMPS